MSDDELLDLLRRAETLLADARSSFTDPGLARRWGAERRRVRDAILALLAERRERA